MSSDNKTIHAKSITTIVGLLMILLFAVSCKECPTEPDYDIYLSVEEVLCTQVTFIVTLPDSGKIDHFALDRNDSTVATYTCSDDDTLIIDCNLKPDTDYNYRVRFLKDDKTKAESEPITVHTILPTSHDFTWEVDTLGHYGSFLKDAWIVNDTNIWVVGALIVNDSTSLYSGQQNYNAARWNGVKWLYELIGSPGIICYGIHYFSENNIWVTAEIIYHWDGNEWKRYHLWYMDVLDESDGGVKHIWASSPDDIYFVGDKGCIVHYDGSTFTKMESGTDSPIVDIWGIDENHIWAIAKTNSVDDNHPDGYESVTFFFNGNRWIRKYVASPENSSEYSSTEIAGYMNSVWAYENTLYISSHSGLWKESIRSGKGYLDHGGKDKPLDGRPFLIRGTGNNDIYAFTHWAEFLHYNGEKWNQDLTLSRFYVDDATVKEDIVVLVGDLSFSCAIVVRGYHLH